MLTHAALINPPANNPNYPVSTTAWQAEHVFTSGTDEDVLTRDSSQITGASWISRRTFRNGLYLLRDWQAATAKVVLGTVTQAIVAWIGDSWASQGNITNTLQTNLRNILGDGGPGFIGANTASFNPTGITRTEAGTWTHGSGVSSSGVSLTDATSSDTATPGSLTFALTLTNTATDFVIHYLKKSGGGTFTWQIDGGATTPIVTSNASSVFASVTISGLSNAAHTLKLTITSAGTTGVTIMGVDCQVTTVAGARFHNLGFTGTSTVEWSTIDATLWEAGLTALNPNLVVIMLGVNDQGAALAPATYQANLTTLITRIRAVMPRCDVVLASPGDTGVASPTYTMAQYAAAMKSLAPGQTSAYFDGYSILGDYTTANARGLYTNTTHVNASGGQVLANACMRGLTEHIPLLTGNYFDQTGLAKGAVTIGTLTVSNPTVSGNLNLAAASYLQWVGRATLHSPAVGQISLENYAADKGVGIDLASVADGTATFRNRAYSADAQLAAASERGNAVAVASLPASPVLGMLATVNNATATTAGSIVAGGGAHNCLVWYDGTNWRIAVGT